MGKRWIFPVFNTLICTSLGALIGYYIGQPAAGIVIGAAAGLIVGLVFEWLSGRRGLQSRLYRRRVVLLVALEIPLAVFVIGPYALVLKETRPDPHPVCCETPLDYGASTYEEVQIQTADGETLAGWFVPPIDPPGPAIVLLHGARGDRRGAAWHAARLIHAGYGVLLYDQRALGESTGQVVSLGRLDAPDLLTVMDYLAARPEVDANRIGAVGLSGGGHIALNAAYQAPDRFGAVWLDGIQAQRLEDYPAAENAGEQFATFMNGLVLMMAEIHLGAPWPPAFRQILAELDQPSVFIVAAGQDDFERRVNQNYAGLLGANTQLWLIEAAGHLGGPMIMPDEYERRMLAFFAAALGE